MYQSFRSIDEDAAKPAEHRASQKYTLADGKSSH
jgi:hypothetical protein